ncbi:unnamed protein product, partial [Ectocarpus fasciculatus]
MSENQQQDSSTADAGCEHDDWKDFSCVTKWEYFINDVAGAAAATTHGRSKKQLASYDGRSYFLRRLVAGPNSDNSNSNNNNNNGKARMAARGGAATAGGDDGDISEFPDLASFFGEEECSLDAWLAPEASSSSATMSSREEEANEREFLEDMEAWRLLRSWFGFGDLLCLHEAAPSPEPSSSFRSGNGAGAGLSLEQLLSTGVIAMEDRRCGAVLAVQQQRPGGGGDGWRDRGNRDSASRRGVSIKGYATLSPTGDADWTRRAETVRLESEASSVVPRSRLSLEALGELLTDKALSAWGRRGYGGRLEASARYTWERRLYDGRVLGGEEGGEDDIWQTEWRAGFLRERSHRRRGTRECAVRALLASARGEHGIPAWGPEGDPLDGVRLSAVWRGLGGDGPLPHAPLELLCDHFSSLGGGNSLSQWEASVSWETTSLSPGSLGLKLRLLLAVYVHCLALGGDLLMADICSADAEAELSSARERARHIGAVLGPSTRELIARMTTAPPTGDGESGDGTDGDDRADPADIVHSARYLLTPRRSRPSRSAEEHGGGGGSVVAAEGGGVGDGDGHGADKAGAESAGGGGGGEERGSPWLWVPRGGAPACRLVSQLALEAARFGAEGVCLGDVAAFWKSFVQELRFLWEESASVPQM